MCKSGQDNMSRIDSIGQNGNDGEHYLMPGIGFTPILREGLDPKSRYYDAGGIETMDIIKAKLTEDEFRGYCKGNALKYLCRMAFKHDDPTRDIEKVVNYTINLKEI